MYCLPGSFILAARRTTQQRIHRLHDLGVAMDLEMAELLDRADALFLHVTRDHA